MAYSRKCVHFNAEKYKERKYLFNDDSCGCSFCCLLCAALTQPWSPQLPWLPHLPVISMQPWPTRVNREEGTVMIFFLLYMSTGSNVRNSYGKQVKWGAGFKSGSGPSLQPPDCGVCVCVTCPVLCVDFVFHSLHGKHFSVLGNSWAASYCHPILSYWTFHGKSWTAFILQTFSCWIKVLGMKVMWIK